MAKKLVKISLATKLRLLIGGSLLIIIAAALVVPWWFMEQLAEQGVQKPGAEMTRLGYNEFFRQHTGPSRAKASESTTQVAALNVQGQGQDIAGRGGPTFVSLVGPQAGPLDGPCRSAKKTFRLPSATEDVEPAEDSQGKTVYRVFRAVRAEASCLSCHSAAKMPQPNLQFQLNQLVGLIDVCLPASTASTPLVWLTRSSFVVGGMLATLLAFVLFSFITQRLVLKPVRKLQQMADKVAEGDLSIRSTVKTGDELQKLGESFNDMLTAINDQHEKLRSANRALDLKLSEISQANVVLFKANQVKNEFLANVSHELRTPLNSIIGFADLISENPDERLSRYGENIVLSAKNLLKLINDILDLAKIEAGKADVRFDKVSVTDTCQTLLALMKPLADKKQLTLQSELAKDVPIVTTDGGKLQQILYNLLSNAIKFTPSGGQVVLTTRSDGDAGGDVHICVSDSGPGIAEADQQHIFEKFHRLDQSLTRESSGTGLGLAISRELTNLIGAKLTLKSEPGHGASFTLILPSEPRVQ
jgi:two-component system sensor histidine kinase BarA